MRSLKQLQIFIEVVNKSGFAAAARHLKMTTAAISKQISALEEELGVQLIRRTTRQLHLTQEGIIYFDRAKGILEALEQAEAEISHSKKEPSGKLKILCGPQFGNLYVIPHLKEFLRLYPRLSIDIEFSQSIPDIEKEKIDLILGLSTSIPQQCIQRRLIFARNVLCASPEYLKKYGEPTKPAQLNEHRIIVHSRSRPNNRLTFKNGEEVLFDPILFFNDTRAMKDCALAGIGIVQLHDYIVAEELKKKKLVEILYKYVENKKTIPLFAAYPHTGHVHINVRKFIDFIVDKIEANLI